MTKQIRLAVYLLSILLSSNAFADHIDVLHAWVRATAPGQDSAAVDVLLTSDKTVTLIGAKSTIAKSTELHTMQDDHGVMQMREIPSIELPAGKAVSFSETGTHLMLVGLKQPIKEGMKVPFTLIIKVSEKETLELQAEATVKPMVENRHHHH
ncbi:MAG: copper chaperone PCu(A)C [Gallionella sp.]|nr:copper chaperone PCu(A)C [Gallionella sp.]